MKPWLLQTINEQVNKRKNGTEMYFVPFSAPGPNSQERTCDGDNNSFDEPLTLLKGAFYG